MPTSKVALFDFDDTILPKDSMARLIIYCIQLHPFSLRYIFKIIGYSFLYICRICDFIKLKEAILFPLDILSNQEISTFYKQCLIPNYYVNVIDEIKQKKKENYILFLVSASPEAYLKYTDLPFDYIIGTKTKELGNHSSSTIIGMNCKSEEKVRRINSILKKNNIEIDYENSYAYSDSNSDYPMMKLVKNRVRISKKDGSMSEYVYPQKNLVV